ncbi:MAG: 4Fe-4S dicluster domain-containing protein [Bacteroidota bacterium]
MGKNYFIFDENKCVGCEACVVACINENGLQEPENWRNINKSNANKIPGLGLFNFSMSCNHCEEAVCMDNCPAEAYSRSLLTGAIIHEADKCIGCQYCTWNCPYDAPKYSFAEGVVSKCNFCEQRLIQNEQPACVSTCPTGALDFSSGEVDKTTLHNNLHLPINTIPSIEIIELRDSKGPKMDMSLFDPIEEEQKVVKHKKDITAADEVPLLIFTSVIAIMIPLYASINFNEASLISKIAFIATAGIASVLSLMHLGQKLRFWRAILNIRKSWLSREIFLFATFSTSAFIDLFIYNIPDYIILIQGMLLLIAIDMLYRPVQRNNKIKIHSAQAVFVALSFYLLFAGLYNVLLVIMLLRLALFTILNLNKAKKNTAAIALRFTFVALAYVSLALSFHYMLSIALFAIGEFIARINFYNGLSKLDMKKILN